MRLSRMMTVFAIVTMLAALIARGTSLADEPPGERSSGPTDLAVTDVQASDKALAVTIFNLGPTDFKSGERKWSVTVKGVEGRFESAIPDLPLGKQSVLSMDLADIEKKVPYDKAKSVTFKVALDPGDPDPSNDTRSATYTPPGAAPAEKETYFTRRYLLVKNQSKDVIQVNLQYKSFEDGAWKWIPADPETGQALSFEIQPGKEQLLENVGQKIATSRVRLWADSATHKWDTYKYKDLWLVSELDGDEHRYLAASMETFTFTFLEPDAVAGDVFTPNSGSEAGTALIESPPAPPEMPVSPGLPVPPAPVVPVVPQPIPNPQPIPLPILPPMPPLPVDADLGIVRFNILTNGSWFGRIQNFGPGVYQGGRVWYLMQNRAGGWIPVAQGPIVPLGIGGRFSVGGFITGLAANAQYFLAISAGDLNPSNDFSGVRFAPASGTDLSAEQLRVEGSRLIGVIRNNGPENYIRGSRTYQMGDATGRLIPLTAPIPNLPVGGTAQVSMEVAPVLNRAREFFLILSPGDPVRFNDFTHFNYIPGGSPAGDADLAVTSLTLIGHRLVGTVTNLGPAVYDPRALTPGASPRTARIGAIGAAGITVPIGRLAVGASQSVPYVFPRLPSFPTTLIMQLSPGDSRPDNDSQSQPYTPGGGGGTPVPGMADCAVTNVHVFGTTVTGLVKNLGPGDLPAGRGYTFSVVALGRVVRSIPGVLPALRAVDPEFGVSVSAPTLLAGIPPNTPVQVFLTLARSPLDANTSNDSNFASYTIPGGNSNQVADLGIIAPRIDPATRLLTFAIANNGPAPFTGGRVFTVTATGLSGVLASRPIPNLRVGQTTNPPLTVNLTTQLAALQPGARTQITIAISGADGNPSNDRSASLTYTAPGTGSGNPDLAVVNAHLDAATKTLSFAVMNLGPGTYTSGRTYTIQATGLRGPFPSAPLAPIPQGRPSSTIQVQLATLLSALTPGASTQITVVLNAGDSNPSNDRSPPMTYTAPLGAGGADLGVSIIGMDPVTKILRFSVKNNGPGAYLGGRSYAIRATGVAGTIASGPVPGLAAGHTSPPMMANLAAQLGAMRPGSSTQITVSLTGTDTNAANDTSTPYLYRAPAGGGGVGGIPPPAGHPDLRIAAIAIMNNQLKVQVINGGTAKAPAGRVVGVTLNPGRNLPNFVLPEIAPHGSAVATWTLPAGTPINARVVATVNSVAGDPPGNDSKAGPP